MISEEVSTEEIESLAETFERVSDELMVFTLGAESFGSKEIAQVRDYLKNSKSLFVSFEDLATLTKESLPVALKSILEMERVILALEPTLEEVEVRLLMEPEESAELSALLSEVIALKGSLAQKQEVLKEKWETARGEFITKYGEGVK